MAHRSGLIAGALVLTASLAVAGLSSPTPSWAAAGAIELSDDGVSFGSAYPGTLLDSLGPMIPGDSGQETFFLRNTGDAPGFLRVTLRDVTFTDTDFAQALTITTSTVARAGDPVVLGSVNPCWVLVEGQKVGVGETVAVTTTLALGNLDGLAGQGATANAVLRVSLDDTSAGALPSTDCGGAGTDIPVLPPASRNTPGHGSTIVPTIPPAAPLASEQAPNEAGGDLPVLNLPGGIVIDPNTWHLFEEFLVLVLFASAVLGAGWFMIVARRRRRREDEAETDVVA